MRFVVVANMTSQKPTSVDANASRRYARTDANRPGTRCGSVEPEATTQTVGRICSEEHCNDDDEQKRYQHERHVTRHDLEVAKSEFPTGFVA